MDLAIIGSTALSKHDYVDRDIADLDIVCSYSDALEFSKGMQASRFYPIAKGKKWVAKNDYGIAEFEIAWEDSIAESLLDLIKNDPKSIVETNGTYSTKYYASLDVLYMLKMSHRFLRNSPFFKKTMADIHKLRDLGAVIRPEHEEFYRRRQEETYWYKHPNLHVEKKNFFKDDVPYMYDHDTIHESVKLGDVPAYSLFLKDGEQVACDKNKFFDLPFQTQINAIVEEASVLAIERSLTQFEGVWTERQAFEYALMKVCTSITSGWFREFAWEHYNYAIESYDSSYFENFKTALANGLILPFKK